MDYSKFQILWGESHDSVVLHGKGRTLAVLFDVESEPIWGRWITECPDPVDSVPNEKPRFGIGLPDRQGYVLDVSVWAGQVCEVPAEAVDWQILRTLSQLLKAFFTRNDKVRKS